MPTAVLTDRAVIALSGVDARGFLQDLVTNDMDDAQPGHAIYAALLTPQGKILFDFLATAEGERFLLDCAAPRAEELARRLGFFRLRAKVEIAKTDMVVAASWGEGEAKNGIPDPRLPELGTRIITQRDVPLTANAALADYHGHRLALGIPDSADLAPDTVFALDAGLEELHGVSFTKGCFVGQEVTARMKHRATARRRILIADTETAPPAPGTLLMAAGKELGNLMTGQGNRALALIRLDRLADAETARAPITTGDAKVTLRKPAWLRM